MESFTGPHLLRREKGIEMKVVYVVYDSYGEGNYSKPIAVFVSEKAAEEYARAGDFIWEEMEIEE